MEELFHLVIENVKDYAIFILDPHGRALVWNAGVKRMLGYDEQEFVGLKFERLFASSDQEAAARELERAAASGRSDDERWHVRKDGNTLWVSGTLTALRDAGGELRGFVKIMRDTTGQRQASLEREELLRRELSARESAERANHAKDEFLATVSHELRTPLNAILGWARLLASGQLDKDQSKRALETLERNAKAQSQLVADLLEVSRVATGKLQLNLRTVSLQDVVRPAVESLGHAAASKNISITSRTTGNPRPIVGDPERLHQVVLNLLSNAIKFTDSGGAIDIHLEGAEDEVRLIVRDTGQGIPPAQLPHIFDRFQQWDPGARTPAGGLGLGLTIARHILNAHNGSIEAHSEGEGTGATFIARLPVAQDVSPTAEEPTFNPRLSQIDCPPELRGKSALVVEDQPDSQELAAFVLRYCGMDVSVAESAVEALRILAENPVDVIVSDIGLSGERDGLEMIEAVRKLPDPIGHIPALVVTAHANRDDRARALAAGYELHVAKPVEPTELIGAVAALLRSKAASPADVGR